MDVKSYILKLLVLPKSATFVFVALFLNSFAQAENVTDRASFVKPSFPVAAAVFPPGIGVSK